MELSRQKSAVGLPEKEILFSWTKSEHLLLRSSEPHNAAAWQPE